MDVHLPGSYVDRVVPATVGKRIEFTTLRQQQESPSSASGIATQKRRERIARRSAKELKAGGYCNLGVGMPFLAANFLEPGVHVWLQSENGILGVCPYPDEDQLDASGALINCLRHIDTNVQPGTS
jgi:3-oxoacid CoA-transferase